VPTDDRADTPPKSLQSMTLALVALGVCAAELALAGPHGSSWIALAFAATLTAGLVFAHRYWRRCSEGGICARHGLPVVFGLSALLVGVEGLRWVLQPEGLPLELQLFAAWRGVGVVLAAFVNRPLLLRIAGAVSASWVLFASCLVEGPLMFGVLVCYAILGSLWLSTLYWSLVQRDLVSGSSSRLRVPVVAVVWCALVLVVILLGAGPQRSAMLLAELLPTSGGTDQFDPRSRGGINDGDDVVAARDQARSAGAVDSNIFFDSEERSFYDAAQDIYGEPRKPREYTQAIAIEAERMRHDHNLAEQQQARREFSLTRRDSKRPRRPEDRFSDALLHVEGPAPLHVRMFAYDTCDGVTLRESDPPAGRPELTRRWGGWLQIEKIDRPQIFGGSVRHTFRIVNLEARQLPMPTHVDRFLLGKVDQARFFGWTHPGILGLVDGKIPRNTVLHTRCRTVDDHLLRDWNFPAVTRYAMPHYREVPSTLREDPRIEEMARRIVGDRPRGWSQIRAVEEYLRNHYVHVREAKVPEDRDDPVPWFLFDSQTGPDYLFAAAACVLLRQLDYPARVASGFYVDPANYNPESGQMSVYPDDIHFWAEVLLPGDEWLVVEPTPGYEKMPASPHLIGRLFQLAGAIGQWLVNHWAIVLGVIGVAMAMVWQRRRILAGLYWLRWRLTYRGSWRQRVLSTLRLLEAWAGLEGQKRPVGWTPQRWYEKQLRSRAPAAATFFHLTSLAAYGQPTGIMRDEAIQEVCLAAVSAFRAGLGNSWQKHDKSRASPVRRD